jgi:transcriptional regulator with XRE-family HTH domain
MTLAQRVRDQRYAKGWGPDELASRAAISRTALYQIESGKTEQPRAATLRRIAQALDIPTEALLGPHLGLVSINWASPEPIAPNRVAEAPTVPARYRLDETAATARTGELDRKFRELLASPLGEGVARIVEETYRILPHTQSESGW